jgi:hypothetical protein
MRKFKKDLKMCLFECNWRVNNVEDRIVALNT